MLSFFVAVWAAAAQLAIDPAVLSRDIEVLASDEFEGRGPGTAGERKTIDYLVAQFKKAGAQPAGDGGDWTQAMEMHRQTIGAKRRIRADGPRCAIDLAPDTVLWTRNPAPRVALDQIPVVFAGHGVNAPAKGWDDYAGADVRGKLVLLLANDPDWQQDDGPFGGKRMSVHARLTTQVEEAGRRGAAAVLAVHDERSTQFDWATSVNLYGKPVSGVPGADMNLAGFSGYIAKPAAQRLLECAGKNLETESRAAARARFRARELDGLRFSAEFDVASERTVTRNVVARLPGAKYPDEHFAYTAHWDHLGIGAPDKTGDAIYNGALDNAGGAAALLSLARAFSSGPRPQRSILFIATTLEESGLLGAEYFAAHPLVPLEKIAGGINMDAVNLIGPTGTMEVTSMGQSSLEDYLKRELATQGREMKDDPNSVVGFYYRSDHFPFAKRGVPFIFAGSGWELAPEKVPNTRDPEVGTRYHQPMDQWYPELDFAAAARDIDIYYRVGQAVANSRDWPRWNPGTEFAVERAKTEAARR